MASRRFLLDLNLEGHGVIAQKSNGFAHSVQIRRVQRPPVVRPLHAFMGREPVDGPCELEGMGQGQ